MHWIYDTEFDFDQVDGLNCYVTLEKRPAYCDRGNFIAKIFVKPGAHPMRLFLDEADGWPRYYFDEGRAKAEVEAWLVKRKEAV